MSHTLKNNHKLWENVKPSVKLLSKSDTSLLLPTPPSFFELVVITDVTQPFMEKFTPEQRKFIEDKEIVDGKLIASPGAGKSSSVLARQIFMVKNGYFTKKQIITVTFTKFSAKDIQDRILTIPKYEHYFQVRSSKNGPYIQSVRTIDSMAHQVMRKFNVCKTDTVQILSVWFLRFLNLYATEKKLRQVEMFKHIRVLFVDEAQDLNETQYHIILKLKELLNLTVYLIGDPNQSIYGFRGSSPCYLIDFPGKVYELTYNFRSTGNIIKFTEHLKPHKEHETKVGVTNNTTTTTTAKPHMLHLSFSEFSEFLSTLFKKLECDLSEVAILCPTKGNKVSSDGSIYGLSRMANLLDELKIPFVQMYNESGNQADSSEIKYEKIMGAVNLLTYHGSKGREWKVVICADLWFELMNRHPSVAQHHDHQYLIYVATTRAKDSLYVYMGKERKPSPYLYTIPYDLYEGTLYGKKSCKFNESVSTKCFGIREAIENISPETMLDIEQKLKYNINTRTLWKDYRDVVNSVIKNDSVLFGIFLENLFSFQCALSKQHTPKRLPVIENIIGGEVVMVEPNHYSALQEVWCNCQSWDDYDRIRSDQPAWVLSLVSKYMKRSIPWGKHLLTMNQYLQLLVEGRSLIDSCYTKYKEATTWKASLKDLFYLTVVSYSYTTNHLFNMKQFGVNKSHLVHPNLMPLFEDMATYATKFATRSYGEQISVRFPYLRLLGHIDLKFMDGTVVEFKASNTSRSLYHMLQLFAYVFGDADSYQDLVTRPCMLMNFLTGEASLIRFNISESDVLPLINAFAEGSSQFIQRMPLVYDLETTGFIEEGAYPDILQISLKDLKYNYFIMKDQHVQPVKNVVVSDFITLLTGISQEDVDRGITLETLKQNLHTLMSHFSPSCTMIAHNGSRFDKRILEHYDLLPQEVDHVDSMTVVRVYGDRKDKLSLQNIYEDYFGEKMPNAHRSSGDVDAIVKILNYLGYRP